MVVSAVEAIISTASTGWRPAAVSCESVAASVRRRSRRPRRPPRRASGGVIDHRLERVRRRDRRLGAPAGDREQPLLDERLLLDRQLDAEVPARHHRPVGGVHDLLGVRRRLGFSAFAVSGISAPRSARRLRTGSRFAPPDGGEREEVSPCRGPRRSTRCPRRSPRAATPSRRRLSPWREAALPPTSTVVITSPSRISLTRGAPRPPPGSRRTRHPQARRTPATPTAGAPAFPRPRPGRAPARISPKLGHAGARGAVRSLGPGGRRGSPPRGRPAQRRSDRDPRLTVLLGGPSGEIRRATSIPAAIICSRTSGL